MRLLLSYIASFLIVASLQGQNSQFRAYTDGNTVVEGGYVDVTFQLDNADGSSLQAPTFSGFKVVAGPSKSTEVSIINGRQSQKIKYIYTLLALKEGSYDIGAARIKVGNKWMSSRPFTIEVVKGKKPKGEMDLAAGIIPEDQVFVRAEISDSVAYVGQQVVIHYKLYSTVNIQGYDITAPPSFDGFHVQVVRDGSRSYKREIIDGVQYQTATLKSYALFPQRTGDFEFEPAFFRLGIPLKEKNSRSFFFNRRVRQHGVKTNGLKLSIEELPDGAPTSFSGGIGKYSINTRTSQRKLTTDDALTIVLDITGNGDSRHLTAPDLNLPEHFEVYEPKLIKEEASINRGSVINFKTYEYLAVPTLEGQHIISPEFSYYDTDSSKYVTLSNGPLRLDVSKGSRPKSKSKAFISGIESEQLKPLIENPDLEGSSFLLFNSPVYWSFFSMSGLAILGMFVFKIVQSNKEEVDPELLKIQNANKVAKQKLSIAKQHLDADEDRQFYTEINQALWGYASDKLSIEPALLSKDNLAQKLDSLNLDESSITEYLDRIKSSEAALYGGQKGSSLEEFYNDTAALLSNIESKLS